MNREDALEYIDAKSWHTDDGGDHVVNVDEMVELINELFQKWQREFCERLEEIIDKINIDIYTLWNACVDETNNVVSCLELYTKKLVYFLLHEIKKALTEN